LAAGPIFGGSEEAGDEDTQMPAPGLKDTDLSEPGPSLVCRAIFDLTHFAAVSAE
jgi:hypothetical protein